MIVYQDMIQIIIIDKSGNIKAQKVKTISFDTLYKKCGFRKQDDRFKMQGEWECMDAFYSVWGRTEPNAGQENKYELPPPIDTVLLSGSIAIIKTLTCACNASSEDIVNLKEEEWSKVYEHLFGGFDDVNDDTESSDELNDIPDEKKTQEGYLKDGFIIDDDNSNNETDDESEEEYSELSEDDYISDDDNNT
jgi:hypothetical protein